MFSREGGGMTPFDISEQLVGPGYLDSVSAMGKTTEPMCLVELPLVRAEDDLDFSLYPMPTPHPDLHLKLERPYTRQTTGGKAVVVANLNDSAGLGFRMCLNLADKHWSSTRYVSSCRGTLLF